ncbi:DNA-processing protein DprA [Rhodococcus ruber]|uniref:DNA-processing protein DprA n=1 Tax=Rhodococcus sp. SJ TaxID=3434112 RepID=UPI003D7B613D
MSIASNLKVLTAFEVHRTPARVIRALLETDHGALRAAWKGLSSTTRSALQADAENLGTRGIRAIDPTDALFPESLVIKGRPIVPALFCKGNLELLKAPGIGVCGSRDASIRGVETAQACATEAVRSRLSVISGYARGVDTESSVAALRNGGRTLQVLPEGVNHFRPKEEFSGHLDEDSVLIVSQFHPQQPWEPYTAMARNRVVVGLGRALVVVEAGDKGGSLAAGREALRRGRSVLVPTHGSDTPRGNLTLIDEGARAVRSRDEFHEILETLQDPPPQVTLL